MMFHFHFFVGHVKVGVWDFCRTFSGGISIHGAEFLVLPTPLFCSTSPLGCRISAADGQKFCFYLITSLVMLSGATHRGATSGS